MSKVDLPQHLLPNPDSFDLMADWLDKYDEHLPADDKSSQRDLRVWAKTIRELKGAPIDELLLPDPVQLEMLAEWFDLKASQALSENGVHSTRSEKAVELWSGFGRDLHKWTADLRTWACRLREFGVSGRFKPNYRDKRNEN